jgi:hypothetical protein
MQVGENTLALVRSFRPLESERSSLHDPVEARFAVYHIDGKGFVQINTYGREDRQTPGKVSQSIQLDEGAARQLVSILRGAFKFD